jgi:hypothetical protein
MVVDRVVLSGRFVLIGFLLVGCQALGLSGPAGEHRNDIGTALVNWTMTAKSGDQIALRDLTDFDWDRVLVGQSYYPNEYAEHDLGFAWDAEKLPSYTNEGLNFLAFVAGDRVVAWTTVTRLADIAVPSGGDGAFLTGKDSALFVWDGAKLDPVSS